MRTVSRADPGLPGRSRSKERKMTYSNPGQSKISKIWFPPDQKLKNNSKMFQKKDRIVKDNTTTLEEIVGRQVSGHKGRRQSL